MRSCTFLREVFSKLAKTNQWIAENKLTGILTLYPIDQGTYAWATSNGYFSLETEEQKSATFMANFSHSAQEHYHYRNGREDDGSEDDD